LLAASILGVGHHAWRARAPMPMIWAFAARLMALLALQVGVGLWVFFHRGSVPFRTAHVAVGALVLSQSVLLAWHVLRSSARGGSKAGAGYGDFLLLTKARLSSLVLMSTAVGYWLGMTSPRPAWHMVWACAGTWLVVAGANALNQWMEREADGRMERTKARPLPAGRLSPRTALLAGAGLSAAGLAVLGAAVNPLSAVLAAVSWGSYVLVYTPLKRVTPLSTLIGAIPGALPPVIGWAAARGDVHGGAWALFGILFLWQLPHFLAIAILYRDDYARGGFPMLPLIESDGAITARQILLYGAALLPISLLPAVVGVSGRSYFYGALTLSLAFLAMAARTAWLRSPRSARQLFHASIIYLPVLLGLLAIDRIKL
jgi:protoheme IX farnesyltransferase